MELTERVDCLEKTMLKAKVAAGVLGVSAAGLFVWIMTLKGEVDAAKADAKRAQEQARTATDDVKQARQAAVAAISEAATNGAAAVDQRVKAAEEDAPKVIERQIKERLGEAPRLVRVFHCPLKIRDAAYEVTKVDVGLAGNQFITVEAPSTPYPHPDNPAGRAAWVCSWRRCIGPDKGKVEISAYEVWQHQHNLDADVCIYVWEGRIDELGPGMDVTDTR